MANEIVCLGPYTLRVSGISNVQSLKFTDSTKTKRVVVIATNGSIASPSPQAKALHEFKSDKCSIKWFELPDVLGRTYTVLPTACEVVVTSFDNGLISHLDCDATLFGTGTFEFGKIFSGSENRQIFDSNSQCSAVFEFDGHVFTIKGQASASSGLFTCGGFGTQVNAYEEKAVVNTFDLNTSRFDSVQAFAVDDRPEINPNTPIAGAGGAGVGGGPPCIQSEERQACCLPNGTCTTALTGKHCWQVGGICQGDGTCCECIPGPDDPCPDGACIQNPNFPTVYWCEGGAKDGNYCCPPEGSSPPGGPNDNNCLDADTVIIPQSTCQGHSPIVAFCRSDILGFGCFECEYPHTNCDLDFSLGPMSSCATHFCPNHESCCHCRHIPYQTCIDPRPGGLDGIPELNPTIRCDNPDCPNKHCPEGESCVSWDDAFAIPCCVDGGCEEISLWQCSLRGGKSYEVGLSCKDITEDAGGNPIPCGSNRFNRVCCGRFRDHDVSAASCDFPGGEILIDTCAGDPALCSHASEAPCVNTSWNYVNCCVCDTIFNVDFVCPGGIHGGFESKCKTHAGGTVECLGVGTINACCLSDQTCIDTTQEVCDAEGGVYNIGLNCWESGVQCAPKGACCIFDDPIVCSDETQEECEGPLGGVWDGGSSCASKECVEIPGTQACCDPDTGSCQDANEQTCLQIGHMPQGPNTECSTASCPDPSDPAEACCVSGTCFDLTPVACSQSGGTAQGPGTSCPFDCGILEACCFDDGSCLNKTSVDCTIEGGTPQPGVDCSANPCAGTEETPNECEPTGESFDTACTDELLTRDAVAGALEHESCGSHDSPDVTTLQSGQAIVAYEERNKDGQTRIVLSMFRSTVCQNITYYRSLSKGVLLNEIVFEDKLFSDDFNRENTGSGLGASWLRINDSPGDLLIQDSQAVLVEAGSNNEENVTFIFQNQTNNPDQIVSADIKISNPDVSTVTEFGLICRAANNTLEPATYYVINIVHDNINDHRVELLRVIDGSSTIADSVITSAPFDEEYRNFKAEIKTEGAAVSVSVFQDETTLIAPLEDTSPFRLTTGMYTGLKIRNVVDPPNVVTLDNFNGKSIDPNAQPLTHAKFEVFDDIRIVGASQLVMLGGPASGKLFTITNISRSVQENGHPKHTIVFELDSFELKFSDSNNISNISWFIIQQTDLPGGNALEITIGLPPHIHNGARVAVARPSVAVPHNNLMLGTEQTAYVTYEAFENGMWNIYMRQVRLANSDQTDPKYLPPHEFELPVSNFDLLVGSGFNEVIYKIVSSKTETTVTCAIFEVFLTNGIQVVNCDRNVTGTITGTCGLEINLAVATVEAIHTVGGCGALPEWGIGVEITGPFPPLLSTLAAGSSEDPDCLSLGLRPNSVDDWCFAETACKQKYITDDPYCPISNPVLTYYPEDLYTIKVDDDITTRVLYHAGISETVTLDRIDLQFVIDHSQSMGTVIEQIRQAVPIIAQAFDQLGTNISYGFVVYGRGESTLPGSVSVFSSSATSLTSMTGNPISQNAATFPPEGSINCGGDSTMFDGLKGFDSNGFTSSIDILSEALGNWYNGQGHNHSHAGFSALQFGMTDSQFSWRENSIRFQILITSNDEGLLQSCGGLTNTLSATVAVANPAVDIFKDDFNRGANDDLGPDWIEMTVTDDDDISTILRTIDDPNNPSDQIIDITAATGKGFSVYTHGLQTPDMSVSVDGFTRGGSTGGIVLICRATTASAPGSFYRIVFNAAGAVALIEIDRVVSGASTGLTSTIVPASFTTNRDRYRVTCQTVNGDVHIRIMRNETLLFDFTDADGAKLLIGNFGGIGIVRSTSTGLVYVDNFTVASLIKPTTIIPVICVPPTEGDCTEGEDGSLYIPLSADTNWMSKGFYSVHGSSYVSTFDSIVIGIIKQRGKARVIERDVDGYNPTFLNNIKVLITYEDDLSDLWTYEKSQLKFSDSPPFGAGPTKGLGNEPFKYKSQSIYGVDTVEVLGDTSKWMFFDVSEGASSSILLDHPVVGVPMADRDKPILIQKNATRAVVQTNHRNDVFVAYESHELGTTQIELKGTGDFHQNSITGPKGSRITQFFISGDFKFNHAVTVFGEGINQLCDFVVDKSDITHIVWQSNRDQVWEIYYANSFDLFTPVRITEMDSRVGHPSIDVDDKGNIFVVYHDNRFNIYEIMLSFKNEQRVIPLLQQDPYLDSLRSGYTHYTNILPVFLTNVGDIVPAPDVIFGSEESDFIELFLGQQQDDLGSDWLTITNSPSTLHIDEDRATFDVPGGKATSTLDRGSRFTEVVIRALTQTSNATEVFDFYIIARAQEADISSIETYYEIKIHSDPNATSTIEAFRIRDGVRVDLSPSKSFSSPLLTTDGETVRVTVSNKDDYVDIQVFRDDILKHTFQDFDAIDRITTGLYSGFAIETAASVAGKLYLDQFVLESNSIFAIDGNGTRTFEEPTVHNIKSIAGSYTGLFYGMTAAGLLLRINIDYDEYGKSKLMFSTVGEMGKFTKPASYDDFDRINNDSIGSKWHKNTGTSDLKLEDKSVVLRDTVAKSSRFYTFRNQTTTSDQIVAVNISTSDEGKNSQVKLVLRANQLDLGSNKSSREYYELILLSDGQVLCNRVIGTFVVSIGSAKTGMDITASYKRYKAVCEGTAFTNISIVLYIDDTKVASFRDTSAAKLTAGRYTGIELQSNQTDVTPRIDNYIAISTIDETPTVSTISDSTFDNVNRLWLQSVDHNLLADSFVLKLKQIDIETAATVASGDVFTDLTSSLGGAAGAFNGSFYIIVRRDDKILLYGSTAPFVSGGQASFDFGLIGTLDVEIISLTTNGIRVFGMEAGGSIYKIDVNTAVPSLTTSVVLPPVDPYDPYAASAEATSVGFKFTGDYLQIASGTINAGSGDPCPTYPCDPDPGALDPGDDDTGPGGGSSGSFFHTYIEFYDNKNLEGVPAIIIDSRKNIEAFINDEDIDNPYIPVADFEGAKGVFLSVGESGFIFFDASHFRPQFSSLAYPYGFETNQTYFPKVFSIDDSGTIKHVPGAQTVSFSCNRCTKFGNNNFNSSGCSYSFTYANEDKNESIFANFEIEIYADKEKTALIRKFNAKPGESDLQFMEVNNDPAEQKWQNVPGLEIAGDGVSFIQVYPALDTTAGLLCGVPYYVTVNACSSKDAAQSCTTFVKLDPDTFTTENIDVTDFAFEATRLAAISNQVAVVYTIRSTQDLHYATLNEGLQKWIVTEIEEVGSKITSPSLVEINLRPAIAYVKFVSNTKSELRYVQFNGSVWVDEKVDTATDIDYITVVSVGGDPAINYRVLESTSNSVKYAMFNVVTDKWEITNVATGLSRDEGQSDLAIVNSVSSVVYYSAGTINYKTFDEESSAWSSPISVESVTLKAGPRITDLNSSPSIAYARTTEDDGDEIRHARLDGSAFAIETAFSTLDNTSTIKDLGVAAIAGSPAISFAQTQTIAPQDSLRYSLKMSSGTWSTETVDSLFPVDSVDLINFREEAVISWRQENTSTSQFFVKVSIYTSRNIFTSGISPEFFCECASTIFDNRQLPLSEIGRWKSSAQGYSDTRITDSVKDSMRPSIKVRKTLIDKNDDDSAVVLFEDYNTDNPKILGATFKVDKPNEHRSTGTKFWFDYDFNIGADANGARDVDLALDFYDRVIAIYEKPDQSGGVSATSRAVPSNTLAYKNCAFIDTDIDLSAEDIDKCDISILENNIVSSDRFVSIHIIKQVRVSKDFVDYFTYNSAGEITPVVSICSIQLEILGTPDVIAFRVKNEIDVNFSNWCPWSPEIGENYTTYKWQLSDNSGIKEVCIQAMTYFGVTTEFCVPIIADYESTSFQIRLFVDGPEDTDGGYSIPLSKFDGFFVAATTDLVIEGEVGGDEGGEGGGNGSGGGDGESSEETAVIKPVNIKIIYIEIVPSIEIESSIINYDVLQQGVNDGFGLPAIAAVDNSGRKVFRGSFNVHRDDKVFNKDGLARIRVKLPGACDSDIEVTTAADVFIRDHFNLLFKDSSEGFAAQDTLADIRHPVSGRTGVPVVIRNQDPYFIFGDPDYILKSKTPDQPKFIIEQQEFGPGDPGGEGDAGDEDSNDGT